MDPPEAELLRRVRNFIVVLLGGGAAPWSAAAGSDVAPGGPVVVSEIQYHPPEDLGADDLHEFVELSNRGSEPVDVSGWRLKDRGEENGFVLPPGTVIAPGGYLVLARSAAALRAAHGETLPVVGDVGFALGNGGDTVRIFDAAGALVDRVEFDDDLPWPPGADGESSTLERISLADYITDFTNFAASAPAELPGTPGAPNSRAGAIPERHDVILNEIMYNPVKDPAEDPLRHCVAEEFVELFHRGARAIDISGWRLAGGIDFRFPAGTRLEAGAHLAVYQDEAGFRGKYGRDVNAVGPYIGDLEDGGETIYLLDHEDSMADRCAYDDTPPWPVNPDGITGSLELADPKSDNERGRAWRESASFAGTPGSRNSATERFAAAGSNLGPQITGVSARPVGDPSRLEVRSADEVRIEARVMDGDGVSSVRLEYQAVAPGAYIARSDPGYETDWTPIDMAVDPERGVHGATLAPFPHRTLVRYRIVARDRSGGPGGGREERYPFPADPEPNLAYFVHDGVRDYVANRRSAFGPPGFAHSDLVKVPVYHIIGASADLEALLHERLPPEDTAYHHRVSFVHEGIVHDHAWIRLRGEPTSRYGSPRRSLKVRFNKGNRFRGRANDGSPYPTLRSKTNLMSEHVLRGDGGVLESFAWKIYRDADVLAVANTFVHLRLVRSVEEHDQFEGDFFGLFVETQSLDTSALQDQGRPVDERSSLYKFEGVPVKQHPDCDASMKDVQDFQTRYARERDRAYFEENLDVPRYLSFRVATELTDNHDMDSLKNFFYFYDSGARRWEVAPWDLDHALGGGASGEEPLRSRVLPLFPLEYENRFRFLWQVLYDERRLFSIIDGWSDLLGGLPDADQDRWDTEPREACPAWPDAGGQCRTFTRFDDRMRDLKSWLHIRSNAVKGSFLDESVPGTPRNERPFPGASPPPPVRISSSPFADPDGDAHAGTRWLVIARDGDWTSPLWDWTTQSDLLETTIPVGIAAGAREYLFRVSHQDSTGRWGFLSEPTSFRVGAIDASPPRPPGEPRIEHAGHRSVSLRWDASEDPQSGILGYRVIRDGAPLTRLPVAGTTQHDFGPTPGGRHVYSVLAVNRAGLSSAPSAGLEVEVPAGGRGGWEPVAGGWDYLYEARPGEDLHVDPRFERGPGYLDGTWSGSSANQWDGSRPGERDGAPGGAAVESLPGAAEDGGFASVLSLEDPGDPASASPLPDNRRLLFIRDLGEEDPFARGVTLIARLRVHPSPLDLEGPRGQAPEPPALRGQLGIGYRGASRRGRFSLWLDERGLGVLGGGSVPVSAPELEELQSFWVTLEESEGGRVRARIYRGGSAEPLLDSLLDLPSAGVESAYTGAYLEMGLANTPEAGAIQIDYFGYRAGVHAPVSGGTAGARFVRGDASGDGALGVGDPILVLDYLFHRGGGVDCLDAADADDSGSVNVVDAILLLRMLSGLPEALPAPFPACGVDPSVDLLPPCRAAPCPL